MKKILYLSLILLSMITTQNIFANEEPKMDWNRPIGSSYDAQTNEYVTSGGDRKDATTGEWK